MKPKGYYSKPLNGQRESRVQSRDASGRERKFDASALAQVLGMVAPRKAKAA